MGKTFGVLDLKCGVITATAANWGRNNEYVLEAFAMGPSDGIHKGVVTDMAKAVDSVTRVLDELAKKTGKAIKEIYVTISSSSIEIIPSSGSFLVSKYGREITRRDMERCVDVGSVVKIPAGKETLHRFIKGFSVDGEPGILNPMGLEAIKLGVDMNVVIIDSTVIRNLIKCVALAGFYIAGCILAGVAYSFRILSEDEKKDGVALLNMCGDMTEIAIFKDSNLRQYRAFHVGSGNILAADNTVNPEGVDEFRSKINSISALHDVKSVVITGEAALNDAVIQPLEGVFSCPARVGFCIAKPLEELPSERMAYVGTLGIMDYLQGNSFMWSYGGGSFLSQKFKKVISFLDNYF